MISTVLLQVLPTAVIESAEEDDDEEDVPGPASALSPTVNGAAGSVCNTTQSLASIGTQLGSKPSAVQRCRPLMLSHLCCDIGPIALDCLQDGAQAAKGAAAGLFGRVKRTAQVPPLLTCWRAI